jgi:hypothetical protein
MRWQQPPELGLSFAKSLENDATLSNAAWAVNSQSSLVCAAFEPGAAGGPIDVDQPCCLSLVLESRVLAVTIPAEAQEQPTNNQYEKHVRSFLFANSGHERVFRCSL